MRADAAAMRRSSRPANRSTRSPRIAAAKRTRAADRQDYALLPRTPRTGAAFSRPGGELVAVAEEQEQFVDSLPTVMVMQERDTPRDTFLLLRGAYDKPGEKVDAGRSRRPASAAAGRSPNNRLGFARWLVDPANPLTARVTVNRFWQMYFGTGLVKTVEDFGSQGEWPSHPELLDWLATEFMRTGWDVKAHAEADRHERHLSAVVEGRRRSCCSSDPENRLLARGPRFRLPAEMIRDQALAVSGLLVEKLGGPSVKPYQPAGLWKELVGRQRLRAGQRRRTSIAAACTRSGSGRSPPPSHDDLRRRRPRGLRRSARRAPTRRCRRWT